MCQTNEMPDALKVIHNRHSVRDFTNQSIPKDIIEKILRAGMAAPSAVNMQPWAFIAVTGRAALDKLGEGLPYAKMLFSAQAAIVVCARPDKAHMQLIDYAVIDCSCAGENILLAIQALGLGAVWTAVYPDVARVDYVREVLNIPMEVVPLAVIPLGYPSTASGPVDKYKPENIHWEQW